MQEMLEDVADLMRLLMQINSIAIAGKAVLAELPQTTDPAKAEGQRLHVSTLLDAIRTVADRGHATVEASTKRVAKELECTKSL